MNKSKNITNLILSLFKIVSPSRKIQLGLVLILILVSSILEVITIAAVFPFLSILLNPESILESSIGTFIFSSILNTSDLKEITLIISLIFAISAIFSGITRFIVLWIMSRVGYGIGSDLSIKIYNDALRSDYSFHIKTKSSELISAITQKAVTTVQSVITPLLTLIANLITLLAVAILLFLSNPYLAISSMVTMTLIYLLILFFTRKKIIRDSENVAQGLNEVIRSVQEGLGAIKHIIIDNAHDYYLKFFKKQELKLRRAQADITIVSGGPRYLIEGMVLSIVALAAYFLSISSNDLSIYIPIIGMFMVAFQRTLPMIQASFSSITFIRGGSESLADILSLMKNIIINDNSSHLIKDLNFEESIKVENLSFAYDINSEKVLNGINIKINKGDRVGIVGPTGSGKTTFIDIILGLIFPSNGLLLIDNIKINKNNVKSWQKKLSHVSQNIFIADGTISQNIALGIDAEKIDMTKVKKSASLAMLDEKIRSLKNGYDTYVGEKGISFSGGQRQRLAIARALYRNCDVLIFDEATSALDKKTEEKIIKSIDSKGNDITIIMVAHRLDSIKNCNRFFNLKNGVIEEVDYGFINK